MIFRLEPAARRQRPWRVSRRLPPRTSTEGIGRGGESQTPGTMKTVSIGDVRLAVEDRGASRRGEPVLLLVHGFPLDHTIVAKQIDHFSVA